MTGGLKNVQKGRAVGLKAKQAISAAAPHTTEDSDGGSESEYEEEEEQEVIGYTGYDIRVGRHT